MDTRPVNGVPPIVGDVLHSPGRPLDPAARAFMQPRFGHDFSRVRIHADSKAAESARAVNALAYTVGQDVVFGAGRYAPTTSQGQKLLAHELTHVVQQRQAAESSTLEIDDAHEQAAQETSTAVAAGNPRVAVAATDRQGLTRETPDYPETKKQVLEELNRDMPVAILGMLDGLDPATRTKLDADPQISQAIAKLPPNARAIVQKHMGVGKSKTAVPAANVSMTRLEFDRIMKDRYRVKTIRTATFQDQSFGDMQESQWKAWDPGSSSMVYNWIVEAFVNLEKTFGGLPEVKDIVFFEMHYVYDKNNHVVKDPKTGASFSVGQMMIYQAVQTGNEMFNQQGGLETPTIEQAVRRNITHELGHGIAETALTQGTQGPVGADPDLFKEYNPAVGWTKDMKLYDIQEPAVQAAFDNNVAPPAQFQITKDNATTKPWKERPLTRYVAENPSEDFAEAIMAYVNEPELLKKYSPKRFAFIEKHKARWIASGQPKVNIWEQVKRGGPARVLKPSQPPTIWERAKESQ